MSFTSIVLIFTISLCFSVQALDCNNNNPCDIGGYYSEQKGYLCIPVDTINVFCRCPNGEYEINQPCRICNRTNPANNPCIPSPNLLSCLETTDFGTTYACLCSSPAGPAVTLAADCNLAVTLTSTMTTTSSTNVPITLPTCFNGGNLVDGICHCPSGYGGPFCQQKFDLQLCERIVCQNAGVCANRNPNGPSVSVCLCRYGTSGDYCELTGTLGFCTAGLCLNNGQCEENLIGSTRHAYCNCQPGYTGIRCENPYFNCFTIGKFVDTYMYQQGKYFECTPFNGSYRLERKSCPKGLRFNAIKNMCTY